MEIDNTVPDNFKESVYSKITSGYRNVSEHQIVWFEVQNTHSSTQGYNKY